METHSLLTALIDDDADDREIFAMAVALLPLDIQHSNFRGGAEAIARFTSNPEYLPDMIFLDLNMPKMNGVECYTQLRKLRHLAEIPICIYSTNLQMIDGLFQSEEHIFFLEKPSDLQKLTEVIGDLLEIASQIKQQTTK